MAFAPAPPAEIDLIQFHIEFAGFLDDRGMTRGFGLSARRILDAEEDISFYGLAGSRIGCTKLRDLLDLLLASSTVWR